MPRFLGLTCDSLVSLVSCTIQIYLCNRSILHFKVKGGDIDLSELKKYATREKVQKTINQKMNLNEHNLQTHQNLH